MEIEFIISATNLYLFHSFPCLKKHFSSTFFIKKDLHLIDFELEKFPIFSYRNETRDKVKLKDFDVGSGRINIFVYPTLGTPLL